MNSTSFGSGFPPGPLPAWECSALPALRFFSFFLISRKELSNSRSYVLPSAHVARSTSNLSSSNSISPPEQPCSLSADWSRSFSCCVTGRSAIAAQDQCQRNQYTAHRSPPVPCERNYLLD